jgi:hypothetical protein
LNTSWLLVVALAAVATHTQELVAAVAVLVDLELAQV